VQHILYDAGEVEWLDHLVSTGIVPAADLQLLFVLGRYADQQIAIPDDLDPFVAALRAASFANASRDANWGVCAFGPHETACLAHAHAAGGRLRVGFENGLWNADGTLAADNAARVRDVASAIGLI
jgi:3-keto-5-aminohexanoate cleavage enzyme